MLGTMGRLVMLRTMVRRLVVLGSVGRLKELGLPRRLRRVMLGARFRVMRRLRVLGARLRAAVLRGFAQSNPPRLLLG